MGKRPLFEGRDNGIRCFEGGFGKMEVVVALAENITICEIRSRSLDCRSEPAVPTIATNHSTCSVYHTIFNPSRRTIRGEESDEDIARVWIVGMSEADLMMGIHRDGRRS